jgi:hypothetical protein
MTTSRPRTRAQRTEDSRARILDAAVECLIDGGYSGATTLTIQAVADVSSARRIARRAHGAGAPVPDAPGLGPGGRGADVLLEWGEPVRHPGVPLPEPITDLLVLWRQWEHRLQRLAVAVGAAGRDRLTTRGFQGNRSAFAAALTSTTMSVAASSGR